MLHFAIKSRCELCVRELMEEEAANVLAPTSFVEIAGWERRNACKRHGAASKVLAAVEAAVAKAQEGQAALVSLGSTSCRAGVVSHRKKAKRQDLAPEDVIVYDPFYSIEAGCEHCVAYLLHVEKVSPKAQSKNCGWTAVHYADWFLKRGEGGSLAARTRIKEMVNKCAGTPGPVTASQRDVGNGLTG